MKGNSKLFTRIGVIITLVAACIVMFIVVSKPTSTGKLQSKLEYGQPDDPHIDYVGRWDKRNPQEYKSNWPGAYFRVNFTGTTASLKLTSASDIYVRIDDGPEVYYAFMPSDEFIVNLTPQPLQPGVHTLQVVARSEKDSIAFAGLLLDDDAQTEPPQKRERWIEFVGDSITAGCCAQSSTWSMRDYAWLAAEELGADHTQIAYSGICLVDKRQCPSPNAIGMSQQFFKLQTVDTVDSPDWSFDGRQPDTVIMNLGTNDYYNGVDAALFREQYVDFLMRMRNHYSDADLIVLSTFSNLLTEPTVEAVKQIQANGDQKVHVVDTTGWIDPGLPDFEDELHPSDYGHEKIAKQLVPIIRKLWEKR